MASVLVVDDERSVRSTLTAFLEEAGHAVVSAENGETALDLARRQSFDVVVADVLMPGIEGAEVVQRIRELSPATQAVLITGDPSLDSAREAIRVGAADYLDKPVGKDTVLEVVARAAAENERLDGLERARLQQEAYREQLERDVTERTADAVMQGKRFAAIAEQAAAGVYETDTDGNCTFVNSTWCCMAGLTPEEATGNGWIRGLHPDDRSRVAGQWEEMVRTGEPWRHEYRFVDGDGRVTWVDGFAAPLLDDNGEVAGYVGVDLDITERRRAEEDLALSQERFVRAMEATRDGLYDWDLVRNEIYYSPGWKRMLGYEYDDLPNDFSVWEQLTDPDDVKRAWTMQKELVAGQRSRFEMEFRMRHNDGHWVDILSRAEAVFDEDGKAVRIIGTHVDLSELKKTEEALRRRLALEELVAGISTRFVSLKGDELDDAINEALARLGEFVDADRSYVFQFEGDGEAASNTHEWCAQGIEPQLGHLQAIPIREELPWFMATMDRQDTFSVPCVEELPSEAAREKAHFTAQDIRSLVVVPMVLQGRLLGFLGFDAVRREETWSDDTILVLRIVGATMAGALERGRQEHELARNQERFSLAERAAGMGVWERDLETDEVRWSDNVRPLFGLADGSSANTYEAFLDRVLPEDRRRIEQEIGDALSVGQGFTTEYRVAWSDGTLRWLTDEARIFEAEGRAHRRLVGTVRDITAQKRAAEALREGEERFRLMFEGHNAVMLLIEPESGRIIGANPAAARFYGYPEEELRDLSIDDINCLAPDQVRAERLRADREAQNYFVFQHRLRSGEVRTVAVDSTPIDLAEGRVLFSIIHDITELKRTEENLQASEQRFRNLYENSPFGIILCELICDDSGKPVDFLHVSANAATLVNTGFGIEDIVGRRASEMVAPDELAELLHAYGGVVRTGAPASYTQHFALYDRTLDVTAFLLHDNTFIVNFIDVTERVRAERELSQQRERLEEEVRERTRELRTMVDAMAGRELRMVELKEEIAGLKRQLSEADGTTEDSQ